MKKVKIIISAAFGLLLTFHVNAQPKKVDYNEANCKKINGVYERFINQVADAISVPPKSIEVIGSTWNSGSILRCTMLIKTPRGNMECGPGDIYMENKVLYAAGRSDGYNNSCSKIK
jgi:hypothetical protein